ncbi:uncharacterized protein LOC134543328 isoform X2 [Bacillus rossius redtenbacheri]|uniref:uncharacterized protein LOC134543328 isoform X2 n=1 Tax=Bacillus rossius redtenbacheri TaxID=93214 RepID=UPI002FDDE812
MCVVARIVLGFSWLRLVCRARDVFKRPGGSYSIRRKRRLWRRSREVLVGVTSSADTSATVTANSSQVHHAGVETRSGAQPRYGSAYPQRALNRLASFRAGVKTSQEEEEENKPD